MILRKTQVIDASGMSLGRLAVKIAVFLIGKHKTDYSLNLDVGDSVFVKNASKIKITGKKFSQKVYRHHTTHPGGLKERPFRKIFEKDPAETVFLAVEKMLPKNKLRKKRIKRLRVEA